MKPKLLETVKQWKSIHRGYVDEHYFCACCGKEITKMDFKEGKLFASPHRLCRGEDGLLFRICGRRSDCFNRFDKLVEERRKYERDF